MAPSLVLTSRPALLGAIGLVVGLCLGTGCQTATTRPGFGPVPEAQSTELRLDVGQATELLAQALGDSVPLSHVEPRDGFIEGAWVRYPGWEVVPDPVYNPSVTRVRVWVDPGRQFWSKVSVEVVYRVGLDPSRGTREFERSVAPSHTVYQWVDRVLRGLARQYGELEEEKKGPPGPGRPPGR